jgi:2-polyprenyl-3-methyl-5-hydroxy-6-metoxy-1,4-benzoquinol methylase
MRAGKSLPMEDHRAVLSESLNKSIDKKDSRCYYKGTFDEGENKMSNTALIYDTGALYGQHMGNDSQEKFMKFYGELFSEYKISTIHDCSIGAGGTTLPLAKLGYVVSGSDLNENLLNRAKTNFSDNGFNPKLFIADFRKVGEFLDKKVDCIISTGNSLPHVDLDGCNSFLNSSHKKINDNGLLFFDIRNWDTINEERSVIHAIDPKIMTAEEHKSVYLLFNWHDNGSVTFTFATSVDKNGRHFSLDTISAPVYFPLLRNDILKSLKKNGYELIKYIDMDKYWLAKGMEKEKEGEFEKDYKNIQWYWSTGKKSINREERDKIVSLLAP